MVVLYQKLQFMEKGYKVFICCISMLILVFGCKKRDQADLLVDEYIVDIYNYFGNSQFASNLDTILFENSNNCFSIEVDSCGDYSCPALEGQVVMYYPSINLICMLCDSLTPEGRLYAYINGSRYLVHPKKAYAIYPVRDFFRKFLCLDLCPGDSLLDDDIQIIVQCRQLYEIIDVDGDFLCVRAAQYDEENIPRIISQPNEKIYHYRWRNEDKLNTSRFAIDE